MQYTALGSSCDEMLGIEYDSPTFDSDILYSTKVTFFASPSVSVDPALSEAQNHEQHENNPSFLPCDDSIRPEEMFDQQRLELMYEFGVDVFLELSEPLPRTMPDMGSRTLNEESCTRHQ